MPEPADAHIIELSQINYTWTADIHPRGKYLREMDIRIEKLAAMPTLYVHSAADEPEQDAMNRILAYAKTNGLTEKAGVRLFGRNTYPDKQESHGYELYLTVDEKTQLYTDIETGIIPGGVYAVLRFKGLDNIGFAWKKLWEWIEKSGREHLGWQKGVHGWVGGFEEQVNWQQAKPPTEWVFDLWVPLKN
jgi:DNA gyrase inhibitor GyrI